MIDRLRQLYYPSTETAGPYRKIPGCHTKGYACLVGEKFLKILKCGFEGCMPNIRQQNIFMEGPGSASKIMQPIIEETSRNRNHITTSNRYSRKMSPLLPNRGNGSAKSDIFKCFEQKYENSKKKSTENCHFYRREKSQYIAWVCFRNA